MPFSKRLNVLIYSGPGTTPTSIRHATSTLRLLLGSHYAITTLTDSQLLKEPWSSTCALLVIPGGADMSYCRTLNGEGNRIIKRYVQLGGSYLGLCAGGYYGSSRCEFEIGKRGMEVAGDRELAFFPGTCRGLAFPGFKYGREDGALAVKLKADGKEFKSYYNGGGLFADAEKVKDRGVEVLATFTEDVVVDIGEDKQAAAIVLCKVGDGKAVLTGPHPEFAPQNLNRANYTRPDNSTLVDDLSADEASRMEFLKSMLRKLGLEVNEGTNPVPSLSHMHISSSRPNAVAELVHAWHEADIISKDGNGTEWINGENDTFAIVQERRRWSMGSLSKAAAEALESVKTAAKSTMPSTTSTTEAAGGKESANPSSKADPTLSSRDPSPDCNAQTKYLIPHEDAPPDAKVTPQFNHLAYFANLNVFSTKTCRESEGTWGTHLLYGEVVTSTSTLLEKNPSLLAQLPDGFTATATTQVSGRGRGTNVWVSPPGALMFSTVLHHSMALSTTAPVVFVQYLAALAIVAGIHNYDKGYEKLAVKLKWPNDIYALDPSQDDKEGASHVKIAGILVNSSYAGGDYTLVVGIGMNVNNSVPSASLSQLASKAGLPPFTLEKLLASILTQFEEIYTRFCRTGFDARLERQYYDCWLHTDQIVTLEAEGGARARIKGITTDWGLLVAEEVNLDGKGTGRRWELMSDSNSFDFFKGLLKKKT